MGKNKLLCVCMVRKETKTTFPVVFLSRLNSMNICSKCRAGEHLKLMPCCHCEVIFCEDHISPFCHECAAVANLILAEVNYSHSIAFTLCVTLKFTFILSISLFEQNEASDQSALLHVQSYSCSSDGCSSCGPMKLECCMCGKHYCSNHRKHGCVDPLKKEVLDKREKRAMNRHKFETAKEFIDHMVRGKF